MMLHDLEKPIIGKTNAISEDRISIIDHILQSNVGKVMDLDIVHADTHVGVVNFGPSPLVPAVKRCRAAPTNTIKTVSPDHAVVAANGCIERFFR